jgi:outer membrane immunogenic protein
MAIFVAGGSAQAQWTGFYVGANAGGAIGDAHATTLPIFSPTGYFATTSPAAILATSHQSISPSGFVGGGQGGFNFQFGRWVVGGELDLDVMSVKDSQSTTGTYPCCAPTGFTVTQTVGTDWLATARPRIGYTGVAGSSSLIFLTGGLAVTSINLRTNFTDTFATAHESSSASQTKLGWTIGGGGEWMLAPGWSLKAEYLYAVFDSITATSNNLTAFTPPIPFPTNTFTHTADLHMHVVRAGFNFHF